MHLDFMSVHAWVIDNFAGAICVHKHLQRAVDAHAAELHSLSLTHLPCPKSLRNSSVEPRFLYLGLITSAGFCLDSIRLKS